VDHLETLMEAQFLEALKTLLVGSAKVASHRRCTFAQHELISQNLIVTKDKQPPRNNQI
jgi:hypothetical protein